jgi:hypothetical protein
LHIDYAIPCRYVEANGNLATIVGAGIDTWQVAELPADLGTMVAARAVAAPADVTGQMVALHCHVESPDGSSCRDVLDGSVGPVDLPDARQDWAIGVFFPIAVRWRAEVEGAYTLHLRIDESEHPLPLHVVQA